MWLSGVWGKYLIYGTVMQLYNYTVYFHAIVITVGGLNMSLCEFIKLISVTLQIAHYVDPN
jgi:hypothetical protein